MDSLMHIETERKFLVKDESFRLSITESHAIRQGYIAHDSGNTVRIRIWDRQGILTIKGPSFDGISRMEWEREISLADAEALFRLCKEGRIEKVRHIIPLDGKRYFELDEFQGENSGLLLAEIELDSPDEKFPRPYWLGEEVTGDRRYYNSYLSKHPFSTWEA